MEEKEGIKVRMANVIDGGCAWYETCCGRLVGRMVTFLQVRLTYHIRWKFYKMVLKRGCLLMSFKRLKSDDFGYISLNFPFRIILAICLYSTNGGKSSTWHDSASSPGMMLSINA